MASTFKDERIEYIGNTLRDMRVHFSFSQEEMADRINVSPSTICRFESGTRVLPVDILLEYARVFDVPVSWLLPSEYTKEVKRELPEAYYKLSKENQKIVQATMCTLIDSLLLQQTASQKH